MNRLSLRPAAVTGLTIGVTIAMLAGSASAGPEWPEIGDAGNLPGIAQIPGGFGSLSGITGSLTGPGITGIGDFQDMYQIDIATTSFSITTLAPETMFDTHLWLFDLAGVGVVANDDDPLGTAGSSRLTAFSNDGSGAVVTPGIYYLAITGTGANPVNASGASLFDVADPLEISGPDGPGGFDPIANWNPFEGQFGDYKIILEGVDFVPVPAPGALAFFAITAVARRRRRRA